MVSLMSIEMLFWAYCRDVHLALCFSYCIPMRFGSEIMLVSYADNATLLAHIPSPNMRSDVAESPNRGHTHSISKYKI